MKIGKSSLKRFSFLSFENLIRLLPVFFAIILSLFFFTYDQSARKFEDNSAVAQIFSVVILLFSVVTLYISKLKNKLSSEMIIFFMFLCGFALRLGYALRYSYMVNQHDVESLQSSGHLSYIYTIFNGALPQTNDWQFSHPPLHHIISALFVKLSTSANFSLGRAFENIQLLTVFYSSVLMIVGYKILNVCKINGLGLILSSALLAFHPHFYILAGSINNDILMILLSMLSVLFLLKWWNKPCFKYALICGLFCGLAVATKVSAVLIACVTAVSVLVKLFNDKELKFWRVLLQSVSYLLVMLPLSLWHPIRNYILFNQPFGYVAEIPVTSSLYTGDISIFKRIILPFSLDKCDVYVDVWNEYNLFNYTLRNSLFGEYDFGNIGLAFLLVVFNFILIVFTVLSLFKVFFNKDNKTSAILPLIILFIIQIVFFVYFNIRYPFGCTMDFRYIVPVLFCGITFIGTFNNTVSKSDNYISLVTQNIIVFVVGAFSLLSIILFI